MLTVTLTLNLTPAPVHLLVILQNLMMLFIKYPLSSEIYSKIAFQHFILTGFAITVFLKARLH